MLKGYSKIKIISRFRKGVELREELSNIKGQLIALINNKGNRSAMSKIPINDVIL